MKKKTFIGPYYEEWDQRAWWMDELEEALESDGMEDRECGFLEGFYGE